MDFAVPVNLSVKIKDDKMTEKYYDLTKKIRKLWNMGVTVMLIVSGTLGTLPKVRKKDWKSWK